MADDQPEGPPDAAATILVVEDSETIRTIMVSALRADRYRVVEAWDLASARSAAKSLLEERRSIELIVCDVVLPGPAGPEVAGEIGRLHPGAAVLYVTGGGVDVAVPSGADVLDKPFRIDELRTAVAASLSEGPTGPP